jgi:hypothetical protein
MKRFVPSLLLATLFAAFNLFFTATGAFAASAHTTVQATQNYTQKVKTTQVYIVHGIPGVPVDVYVDGARALANFQPGTVVGPVALPATQHTIALYAVNANPATSKPIVQVKATLVASKFPTSLVAHLTAKGAPTITAFSERNYKVRGLGQIVLRHTAALGPVDVYTKLKGHFIKLYAGLSNGQSINYFLPTGCYDIFVTPAGASPKAAPLQGVFTVKSSQDLIVYAVGSPANKTLGVVVETLPTQR